MQDHIIEKFVYFVRHGQSVANLAPVFQGPDDPLSELGVRQAGFVGDRFRSAPADILLTSPMPRARDTAKIIQSLTHLPLEEHNLFREYRPPSALAGKSKDLPEGQVFLRAQREHIADPDWHYADEDNYHDLHNRAVEALAFLINRPEKNIIVVTHVGFMRALMIAMLTEGIPDPLLSQRLVRFLKPQNTGITLCRYRSDATRRNKWRLFSWNDHAHLADTDLPEPTAENVREAEPGEL